MRSFILCLIVLFFATSCMAPYQPIQLSRLAAQQRSYQLSDSDISVTVIQDVFEEHRNQFFSRQEKRKRINLVGLRISNESEQSFHVPEDLLFQTQDGSSILPLPVYEAIDLLCDQKEWDGVEVNGARFLFFAIRSGNQIHKQKIKSRFAEDLVRQYLTDTELKPGASLDVLLALPLRPGQHFHVAERRLPSVLEH